jgi:hypothetical protein
MQDFSRDRLKMQLVGDTGYAFYLGMSFEQSRDVGGLASCGRGFIGVAIQCYLIDLVEPGRKLLEKAIQYFKAAIELQEQPSGYEPGWHEATRWYGLALANWLLNGAHDEGSIQSAIEFREQHLARKKKPDSYEIACYCPEYLDARAYYPILNHIRRTFVGRRMPLEVQYTRLVAEHDGTDLSNGKDVDQLFRRRFPEWLNRGHWVQLATWLKVCRWNSFQNRSPISVIQGALDYA